MSLDTLTAGSKVWLSDSQESWKKGEVTSVQADGVIVAITETGQEVRCNHAEAPIQNPDTRGGVEVGAVALSLSFIILNTA